MTDQIIREDYIWADGYADGKAKFIAVAHEHLLVYLKAVKDHKLTEPEYMHVTAALRKLIDEVELGKTL